MPDYALMNQYLYEGKAKEVEQMTKDALAGIINRRPSRIVYVSCDVATLARDTRALLDAGYELRGLTGIDLFPNTAHVESVAVFER